MSTYTVTGDAPRQIVLDGNSSDVSLVNQGPSTIYLESDTSLTTLNGLALPPMGQMTWNARTPLWAICPPSGTATLLVNKAAGRVDASRAKFWSLLAQDNNFLTTDTISAECGHCETILLKISINGSQAAAGPPTTLRLNINWTDQNNRVIEYDAVEVAVLPILAAQQPSFIFIRIPVIGTFFNLSYVQNNGVNTATIPYIQIFGTDRTLGYRWYCTDNAGSIVLAYNNGFGNGDAQGGDGVEYASITNTGKIWVANLGKRMVCSYLVRGVTTAGRMNVTAADDTTLVAATGTFAVAAGAVFDSANAPVPQKQLIALFPQSGMAFTNYDVAITWSDF